MIDLNKLKAAAEAAKAYQPDAIKAHSFGCFDEEGVFYELGNVCARIYERDENSDGSSADDALLNHIIAASPDAVLELIAMASVAAPQVVADERELPPLPKCVDYREGKTPEYTADQMQAYARAAIAAAPVQAQEPVAETYAHTMSNGRGRPDDPAPFETVCVRLLRNDLPADLKLYAAPVQPVAVPDGLRKAFVTLESCDARYSIVMKFNQKTDAFAAHDFLLGVGSKDYNSAAPAAQGDAEDMERYQFLLSEVVRNYVEFEEAYYEDLDVFIAAIDAAIAAKAVKP